MTTAPEGADTGSSGNGRVPASIRLRWMSVAEAALALGISEVAVRRQLRAGSLTGLRVGRGWRVLLAGDPVPSTRPIPPVTEAQSPPASDETVKILAQTSAALEALVRDLQRQSLALAAQVGYLQSQLVDAQRQVALLTERNQSAVEHENLAPVHEQEGAFERPIEVLRAALDQSGPVEPAQSPRRRWLFWRR